jgi:hypothetical protein
MFQSDVLGNERDKLISGEVKAGNWPISKNILIRESFTLFLIYTYDITDKIKRNIVRSSYTVNVFDGK